MKSKQLNSLNNLCANRVSTVITPTPNPHHLKSKQNAGEKPIIYWYSFQPPKITKFSYKIFQKHFLFCKNNLYFFPVLYIHTNDNNVYKYKLYLQEKKVKEKLSKTGKQINFTPFKNSKIPLNFIFFKQRNFRIQ